MIKVRKQSRGAAGNIANLFFLVIMAGIFALPLVFIISRSLMPMDEILFIPPRFFVRNPTLQNYNDLMNLMANSWVPFSRYIFNSVFVTAMGTGLHIVIASLAAYVLAKHEFPGRNFFFSMVVFALMFAPQVTMIPNYLIMSKIGFVDTYLSLIVPAIGYPLGLFLMKQFMEQIHMSLLESAKMDGAHELTIFFRIAMPLVKPAWLTLMIFSVQQLWNDMGRIFIFTEQLKMLQTAFTQIQYGGIARTGVSAVTIVFMLAVPFFLFIFNQSKIIETMGTSGIKE